MSKEQSRDTPPRDEPKVPSCEKGHGEKEWCCCWKCGGEGVDGHDCGEDCCACFMPEDNVRCDICRGNGGWFRCYACVPATADEEL